MVHHRRLALVAVAGWALTACSVGHGSPDAAPTSPTAQAAAGVGKTPDGARSKLAARSVPRAAKTVVVLDPGHNGGNATHPEQINELVPAGGFRKRCNTTGTATDSGYSEHAFGWDVARRTAKLLRARGISVVLTRSDDDGVGPCVNKRAAIANKHHAALSVSIHADGASSDVRGFHVIEPALAPDKKNREILAASDRAARELLAAFGAATDAPRATYPGSRVEAGLTKRDDLAGLNLARVPAAFIECGNMRNARDARNLTSAAWRQKAAQGIADGILAYLR